MFLSSPRPMARMTVQESILVGGLVFAGALLGILTRPMGLLAAFWPANALLLGALVRSDRRPTWLTWPLAVLGYLAADSFMGDPLMKTMLLTMANVAGVMVGHTIFARVTDEHRRLQSPRAILSMAAIASAAAAAAGVVGSVANPILFGGTAIGGFLFWSVTELVNYLVVLPAVLTAPSHVSAADLRQRLAQPRRWRPLAALLVSCALAVVVGGPGAVAFPMPALLWCALTYRVHTSACLTLALSVWTLLAISAGILDIGDSLEGRSAQMSLRLGVSLMSLAPLVTASITNTRNALLAELEHRASHDSLTELLNRDAFVALASIRLEDARRDQAPAAVLLLDVDHFKKINDTYGHDAGDRVLRQVAQQLTRSVRAHDMPARFGGEEFAIFLARCSDDDARTIAERIRRSCASTVTTLDSGATIPMTVSIGLASSSLARPSLDAMLRSADQALYRAKHLGRNRVEWA